MLNITQNLHKRGDTFDLSGVMQAKVNGQTMTDFSGWTGSSQVRDPFGELVAELDFSWLDQSKGLMRVRAVDGTEAWPVGPVRMDIQLQADSGAIVSTRTVVIEVLEDITR